MAPVVKKRTSNNALTRINAASAKLAAVSASNGKWEKKRDDRYVRNSLALDPDTGLRVRRRRKS